MELKDYVIKLCAIHNLPVRALAASLGVRTDSMLRSLSATSVDARARLLPSIAVALELSPSETKKAFKIAGFKSEDLPDNAYFSAYMTVAIWSLIAYSTSDDVDVPAQVNSVLKSHGCPEVHFSR